jgi:adenosylhomocysteine nucleosidase
MNPQVEYKKEEIGTLVCFALEQEAAPFRIMAMKIPDVAILITGMGPKNADAAVRRFLAKHLPKVVLSCGFAGGLDPALKSGDVVFMTGYPALEERLVTVDAILADFVSLPRIATTAAEKKQLRAETGAAVVEMESGAILAVCRESRIPCAMVRVISDTADEDLPLDFNKLVNAETKLNYAKLVWAIIKVPRKIGALIELHRKTSTAAHKLAEALSKLLW